MKRLYGGSAFALAFLALSSCSHPNAGHGDIKDAMFGRRHNDLVKGGRHDPLLSLAREVTVIEDDLRREGTITVKKPDVWGDGNLIYFIQEHEREMSSTVKDFEETLQAYVSRSDQGAVSASLLLSEGRRGTAPPDITSVKVSELYNTFETDAPDFKTEKSISLEPTEKERQHSTYILVNQALRRRNMGDDNSRAAGYGLYKFRVPVSVLPGRETDHNHSAIVTLRAQMIVDEAHLRYTFPKLVIADIVDNLSPVIADGARMQPIVSAAIDEYNTQLATTQKTPNANDTLKELFPIRLPIYETLKEHESVIEKAKGDIHASALRDQLNIINRLNRDTDIFSPNAMVSPTTISTNTYGKETVNRLKTQLYSKLAQQASAAGAIKEQEVRAYLFQYFQRHYQIMEKRKDFIEQAEFIKQVANKYEQGLSLETLKCTWNANKTALSPANDLCEKDDETSHQDASWIIAIHAGVLDLNLKRILTEMGRSGKLSSEEVALSETIAFYNVDANLPATLGYWNNIIQQEFPLNVFTLDPQVEEQNALDAFSRQREMQVAIAYGLASGRLSAKAAMAASRKLSLDMQSIALNRTVVGFSHSNDTFGWYFYPRIQSPPTESSNIGALARTIWSTGPTQHYDNKHRKLEPGIRECEVIVAMPSFVTKVAFDVTGNWEKLTCPGKTKRSYEEMVAQGGRVHRLKTCLQGEHDSGCFRPGDFERLYSRVEQLEQMLSLQTHVVNLPYNYEQSGTDIFDNGKNHLTPVCSGFYGLSYMKAGEEMNAQFFIRGKNFHPTLTHVVVGGTESDSSNAEAKIEVLSRELLLVKTKILQKTLSPNDKFEVRVGTPGGLSNPIYIPSTPSDPQKAKEKAEFDWELNSTEFGADLSIDRNGTKTISISSGDDTPIQIAKSSLYDGELKNAKIRFKMSAFGSDDKTLVADQVTNVINLKEGKVNFGEINTVISSAVSGCNEIHKNAVPKKIVLKGYLLIDSWPAVELGRPIELSIHYDSNMKSE